MHALGPMSAKLFAVWPHFPGASSRTGLLLDIGKTFRFEDISYTNRT